MNEYQNRLLGIACFILLVAGSALDLCGQDTISKREFEVSTKSDKAASGKSLRQTFLIEQLINGVVLPERTVTILHEQIPPDQRRSLSTYTLNGIVVRRETFFIKGRSWERKNNGPWTTPKIGIITESGNAAVFPATTFQSFTSKGKTMLSGVEVNVYEAVKKTTTSFGVDSPYEMVETTRMWIGESGLKVKEIYETENLSTKTIERKTITFEYNPKNLKIEAPTK